MIDDRVANNYHILPHFTELFTIMLKLSKYINEAEKILNDFDPNHITLDDFTIIRGIFSKTWGTFTEPKNITNMPLTS